jgi:predicted MFS family arabinose efflux permease
MHGLYLLFWVQEKDVSPAIVAAGLAAGDFAVMLFELPTGWVSDRWSPRSSLIIGSLVQVAGMVACWLAPGTVSVVAGTLIIALGDAFRSGADQALLYRTCAALNRVDQFRQIEGRAHAVTLIALVVLVVAGGAIVGRWGFAAGWIAETLLCGAGVILALLMATPPAATDPPNSADVERADQSWKLLTSPGLFRVILPASIIGAAASAASFVAQTGSSASPESVTWLVAALALVEAAGSLAGSRLFRFVRPSWLLGLTLAVVGAAVVGPFLVGAAALLLAGLSGAAHPARAAAIQTLASDAIRARAVSLASACDMAVSSITLPLAGVIRSRRRIR